MTKQEKFIRYVDLSLSILAAKGFSGARMSHNATKPLRKERDRLEREYPEFYQAFMSLDEPIDIKNLPEVFEVKP